MALALYRRYRPDTFDGVIGQDHVTRPLSRALDEGKLTHAYLFSGPRGCGKTSSARILARCINCVNGPTSHPCGECESCKDLSASGPGSIDVVEIDAASHGSVDDARELRERATFAPARDRYKIFILDEAHMVTGSAFNALLKIVEEPPEHVMFIFATTEPDKVIGTIRSRTHHYPFRLVPPEVMGPYLESVCEKEGIQPEAGVLKLAMRAGGGSMRDTLSVLDQLMVGSIDGTITYSDSVALLGFTPDGLIRDAMNAIIERNGSDLYGVIEKVVTGGFDPRKFVEDLLAYVRDLLVLAIAGREAESALNIGQSEQVTQDMQHQVERLNLHQLDLMAQRINTALASMSGTMSPRMRLELLAAQLLVAEQPMHTVAASAAPSAPASSSARLAQSEQNQQALSPRARARATQQAQSAPQSQSVHESPAEHIVPSSVQQ
ncbi:MAG: DNA polymerase III subunit gamma/tau, partial [Alloscardovia omnicolens]|nr:DNA polymerase III subunit gamma/tau [Alloscardovia omnicolens]